MGSPSISSERWHKRHPKCEEVQKVSNGVSQNDRSETGNAPFGIDDSESDESLPKSLTGKNRKKNLIE